MKKLKKIKTLLCSLILTIVFCFINSNVYAKTITSSDIKGPAYVIGSHIFTREVNETTGYEGRLTTNLIMLASQTIESSNLDSMIIYYKTVSGNWINGLTGQTIEPPESFNINYTNLQLEEENNTVTAPKMPILSLNDGPLGIDEETDMIRYQLDIYIDDIGDKTNKVDGVELCIVHNGVITNKDLEFNKSFSGTFTFKNAYTDSYTGNTLKKDREYHRGFIEFEIKANDFYNIAATAYVLDKNGKKTYSESAYVSIDVDKTLPSVQMTNDYQNPDYVVTDGNDYQYSLGIKKPKADLFNGSRYKEKIAYIVDEKLGDNSTRQIGIFKLDEHFTITIPKNTVKTYYARIGYYDVDGEFHCYANTKDIKYFTIDTRELTTPTWDKPSFDKTKEETYFHINSDFYARRPKDSLDYNKLGTEIFEITSYGEYKKVEDKFDFKHVKTSYEPKVYVARVYANDANGKKVYSDYSDKILIINPLKIEASELINGKVTITVTNSNEYTWNYIGYEVYDSQTGASLGKARDVNEPLEISVDSDITVYAKPIYYDSDDVYYGGASDWISIGVN